MRAAEGADPAAGFEAVHNGHLEIHQDDIVGRGGGGIQRELAVGHDVRLDAEADKQQVDDFLVVRIVLGDEHPELAEAGDGGRIGKGGGDGSFLEISRSGRQQGDGDDEGRAFTQGAADGDVSAHQSGKALADGKAEAGAPEAPGGGRVFLDERAEQFVQGIRGDADAGVLDFEGQIPLASDVLAAVHVEGDEAAGGEFHGVVEQIDEDLADAGTVPDEAGGQARADAAGQLDALAHGPESDDIERLTAKVGEEERRGVELDLSALDAGVVEDVIDELEEEIPGGEDGFREVLLLRVEGGGFQQRGHADDRIERSPDFMAHGGEEGALGTVRLLGGITGEDERVRLVAGHLIEPDVRGGGAEDGDTPRLPDAIVLAGVEAEEAPEVVGGQDRHDDQRADAMGRDAGALVIRE